MTRNSEAKVYQPSTSVSARIARKLLPFQARRDLHFKLKRPIVSFTFDDFPRSAIEKGASILEQYGWAATFYVSAGLMDVENHHGKNFNAADLAYLQERGHEIAGHTYSHIDCATSTAEQVMEDIKRNESALSALGVPKTIEHFAWPYGTTTAGHKSSLGKHFKSMRGVETGIHHNKADLNCLKSTPLFSGAELTRALALIETLQNKPGWLIFFTHDVRENPSKWGITPSDFHKIGKAVKQSKAEVLTVGHALQKLGEHYG